MPKHEHQPPQRPASWFDWDREIPTDVDTLKKKVSMVLDTSQVVLVDVFDTLVPPWLDVRNSVSIDGRSLNAYEKTILGSLGLLPESQMPLASLAPRGQARDLLLELRNRGKSVIVHSDAIADEDFPWCMEQWGLTGTYDQLCGRDYRRPVIFGAEEYLGGKDFHAMLSLVGAADRRKVLLLADDGDRGNGIMNALPVHVEVPRFAEGTMTFSPLLSLLRKEPLTPHQSQMLEELSLIDRLSRPPGAYTAKKHS